MRSVGGTSAPIEKQTRHVTVMNVKKATDKIEARNKLQHSLDIKKMHGSVAALRSIGEGRVIYYTVTLGRTKSKPYGAIGRKARHV